MAMVSAGQYSEGHLTGHAWWMSSFGAGASPRFDDAGKLALNKIREAKLTLSQLRATHAIYLDSVEVGFDPSVFQSKTVVWAARIRPPIESSDISRPLRYLIHDLRAALDNMVHGLGVSTGVDEKVLRSNSFPVVQHEAEWKKQSASRLKQLPPVIVERVKRVQPFASPRTYPVPPHPLSLLAELSNADKHRDGFIAALVPNPSGVHQLGEIQFEIPVELSEQAFAPTRDPASVNEIMRFLPDSSDGVVRNGDTVLEIDLPDAADLNLETLKSLDLPLTVTVVYDQSQTGGFPYLPIVIDAWTYVRDVVLYVTGQSEEPPHPAELARPTPEWDE